MLYFELNSVRVVLLATQVFFPPVSVLLVVEEALGVPAAGVDDVAADDALLAEEPVAQEAILAAATVAVPAKAKEGVGDAHSVLGVAVVL